MKDLKQLNTQFSIVNTVAIKHDSKNGLLYLSIKNNKCSAIIYLQGAHLTSWTPRNSNPVFWISSNAEFKQNNAIRGGIPICWPWFGAHPNNDGYPAHGIARTLSWEILSITALDLNTTQLVLVLPCDDRLELDNTTQTRVECVFTIGETLEIELITYNLSSKEFILTEALHSYFNVSDVRDIVIKGLEGNSYLDKLNDFQPCLQTDAISINEELDRIYTTTENECILEDSGFNRIIRILKKHSLSTIVWNPWIEKSSKMRDIGALDYLQMVCIETGNVASNFVAIAPNKKHKLYVKYEIEALS